MTERIITRKDGPFGWLMFNNPSRHNAISLDMAEAVPEVIQSFEADADIRVVLVTGAGERAFAAGSDIALKHCFLEYEKPAAERDFTAPQSLIDACFASEDYQEGRTAFAEKRKPVFKGR